MKKILFIILFCLVACREKGTGYIEKEQVEVLTGQKNIKVIKKLAYNVNESKSLENIILYQHNGNSFVGIFNKEENSFSLGGKIETPAGHDIKKTMFINPALRYSHILLLRKSNESSYHIDLYRQDQFIQTINLKEGDLQNLFIKKFEKRPRDEMLNVAGALYRFDSFEYTETFEDKPLFFMADFIPAAENSVIEMVNRGGYTARAVITISFIDLDRSNYQEQVRLTKDIKTVKMYSPGSAVFRNGGGRVRLKGPTIEIIKEPFSSVGHGRMKLPLFIGDKPGRILVRAVYKYRGATHQWPEEPTGARRERDEQGFWAYRLN